MHATPTQPRSEALSAMRRKLLQAGLGCEEIRVFGELRCNVHVTCVSAKTADAWAQLLATVFPGARPRIVPHVWDAADNRGTMLCPTVRRGYLIGVAA